MLPTQTTSILDPQEEYQQVDFHLQIEIEIIEIEAETDIHRIEATEDLNQKEEIDIRHQKEKEDTHLRIEAKEVTGVIDIHRGVMIVINKGVTNQEIEETKVQAEVQKG